jgi:glycosyltransferase involved in cell wall biosynthesis
MSAKSILYLGNKLQIRGNNPTLIDILTHVLRSENLKVYAYSSKKNKAIRLADMLFAILKHRKKIDITLIDTYSTSAFWFAYLSAKLCRFLKIPYILILHGGELPNRFNKNKKEVLAILNNAKLNVSPSDYLYDFFKQKGVKNVLKIPNFISIENYVYKNRVKPRPHLLWVRAFAEIYNPMLAIRSLELLLKTYPKARLSMVGPKKDHSYDICKSYVEKHQLPVSFTAKLSKQEWIAYAEDFDIFLNTTNTDNTPVSVIEAMGLGMLVISTNVGGIPSLLNDERDSLLVEPNDKEAFVNSIIRLIENPSLAKSLSQNARRKAEQFSWESIRDKWLVALN